MKNFEELRKVRDQVKAELERRISGLSITSLGGVCPYQAEGTLGDYKFYFRSRGCYAALKLDKDDPVGFNVQWSAGKDLPEEEEFTDHEQFKELMIELVQNFKKYPFRYEFLGKKINIERVDDVLTAEVSDEGEIYYGSGHSPEEAYSSLFKISQYLLENGFSEDFQNQMYELRNVNPEPLNKDDRVFDTTEPPFFKVID